jgi:hypothetical protein
LTFPVLHVSTLARAYARSRTVLIGWTASTAFGHTFICRILPIPFTAFLTFLMFSEKTMEGYIFQILVFPEFRGKKLLVILCVKMLIDVKFVYFSDINNKGS